MISVIIPYYCKSNPVQTERLLHRAILSASKEIREYDSYEIIIVDDGSVYPPQNIRTEFGNLPVKLFKQPHGCLGAARNYGIRIAKGDYLLFLDADDYYFPGTLHHCIQKIKECKTELLMYGMKQVHSNSIQVSKHHKTKFSDIISGNQYMATHNLPGSSCSFIISSNLITRNELRFRENSYLEDEDFTPRLLHLCKTLIFTNYPVYAYYTRDNSIIGNLKKETNKRIDIAIEVINRLISFRDDHKDDPHNGLDRKINTLALDCIRLAARDNNWKQTLEYALNGLKMAGIYPLANNNTSYRYSLYRFLLNRKYGKLIIHHIEKL